MPYEKCYQIAKFVPFEQVAYKNHVYVVADMRYNSESCFFEYQLGKSTEWVAESALYPVDEESLVTY